MFVQPFILVFLTGAYMGLYVSNEIILPVVANLTYYNRRARSNRERYVWGIVPVLLIRYLLLSFFIKNGEFFICLSFNAFCLLCIILNKKSRYLFG